MVVFQILVYFIFFVSGHFLEGVVSAKQPFVALVPGESGRDVEGVFQIAPSEFSVIRDDGFVLGIHFIGSVGLFGVELARQVEYGTEYQTVIFSYGQGVLQSHPDQDVVYGVPVAGPDGVGVVYGDGQGLPAFQFAEDGSQIGTYGQVLDFPSQTEMELVDSSFSMHHLGVFLGKAAGDDILVCKVVAYVGYFCESYGSIQVSADAGPYGERSVLGNPVIGGTLVGGQVGEFSVDPHLDIPSAAVQRSIG